MQAISNNNKTSEQEILKAWYSDSLSLMKGEKKLAEIENLIANPPDWQPYLGVVLLSPTGDELYSFGNFLPCRSYIKQKKHLRKNPSETISVDQFEDGLIISYSANEMVRIIFIHHLSMRNILKGATPEVELTNSEFQLLLQILCGLSLKEASKADNVSYETKRSQFKSLANRTGFKSQSELIRNILISLVNYSLNSTDIASISSLAQTNDIKLFLNKYYGQIFRFHQITSDEGYHFRVLETGPANGKPVVWLHSQTLPTPDQFISNWTNKKNIRLIIPLREGFLGEANEQSDTLMHLDVCTAQIAKVIEVFCNSNAEIVANSTGVAYAINLAINYPSHVRSLTICAASYIGKYENPSVKNLIRGFKNLNIKNPKFAEKIFERYVVKMGTLEGMQEIIKKTYQKSEPDIQIFNKILATPLGHSWMFETYKKSKYSIIKDFTMGANNIWRNAHNIKCNTLFIHGFHDPINSLNAAQKAAKLIKNSKFIELQNEGQSLFISLLEELITFKKADWEALKNK